MHRSGNFTASIFFFFLISRDLWQVNHSALDGLQQQPGRGEGTGDTVSDFTQFLAHVKPESCNALPGSSSSSFSTVKTDASLNFELERRATSKIACSAAVLLKRFTALPLLGPKCLMFGAKQIHRLPALRSLVHTASSSQDLLEDLRANFLYHSPHISQKHPGGYREGRDFRTVKLGFTALPPLSCQLPESNPNVQKRLCVYVHAPLRPPTRKTCICDCLHLIPGGWAGDAGGCVHQPSSHCQTTLRLFS